MKKISAVFMVIVTILSMVSVNAFAQEKITVLVDGQEVEFDAEPYIENGRTMVPVRAVFEALNAQVEWDGETQTVTAKNGINDLELVIGESIMKKNLSLYSLDVPALIKNDRTFVPLRAISEALDCNVNWDNDTRTVTIESYKAPIEYTYIQETVTKETDREDVTITVNYTYPQIVDGKGFISERSVNRMNEIAKDVTYDILDIDQYAFTFVEDWIFVMEDFNGYPNITIDIKTVLYVSEKYNTVSFSTVFERPYEGREISTITVDKDSCKKFYDLSFALTNGPAGEHGTLYEDIYNEFVNNFEDVRYGREVFSESPEDVEFFISGDKVTVSVSTLILIGVGRVNDYCSVVRQY